MILFAGCVGREGEVKDDDEIPRETTYEPGTYPVVETHSGPYNNNLDKHWLFKMNDSDAAYRLAEEFGLTILEYSNSSSLYRDIINHQWNCSDGWKIFTRNRTGNMTEVTVVTGNVRGSDEDNMDQATLDDLSLIYEQQFDLSSPNYRVEHILAQTPPWENFYLHEFKPQFRINQDEVFDVHYQSFMFSTAADNGEFISANFELIYSDIYEVLPYISVEEANNISKDELNTSEDLGFKGIKVNDGHVCYWMRYREVLGEKTYDDHDVYVDVQSGEVHGKDIFHSAAG